MQYFREKRVIISIVFSMIVISFALCLNTIKPLSLVKLEINHSIQLASFFKGFSSDAKFITNVSNIDTSKLGKHAIEIEVNGNYYKTVLEIVDTQAPILKTKTVKLGLEDEVTPELFVETLEDETECTLSFEKEIERKSGKQEVVIVAEDVSGNTTKETATLEFGKVKQNLVVEAGKNITAKDALYSQDDIDNAEIIQKVNTKKLGQQEMILKVDEETYHINVLVQDTQKPVVKTQNVTIWWDQKVSSINQFLKRVSDGTSVKKEYVSTINYSKIGTQDVKIKITDEAGNQTEVTAKLTIKKDTSGPVIYNLSTIHVVRGEKINYTKNVTAIDNHDGKVKVSYDKSKVNEKSPGTYKVTYTANDAQGNTTKKTRTVIITGNAQDIKDKLRPIVNSIKGNSKSETALAIRNWVAKNISYTSSDLRSLYPSAWEGITKRKGDCFTHYAISKIMLDLAGIENKQIHTRTKSHYWNLVHVEEGWRHLDSTPGANATKLMTDEEYGQIASWDHSGWPAAK